MEKQNVIIVNGNNWNTGVLGIVASRLVERFNKPTIVISFHKEHGISVGNIIGSNLFNILSVIGLVSFLYPLHVPLEIMQFEIPFMIAFGVVLFPIALLKQPISKITSGILLIGYIAFIILLFN